MAMKKMFIVLLVAAVGAGVYYSFSKKQNVHPSNPKELIVDKWKIDSLVINKASDSSLRSREGILRIADSSLRKYEFEFRKDRLILQAINGKTKDTSHYEFAGTKDLLIWGHGDTTKTKWNISRLDSAAMVVKDQDNAVFYFRRIK